MNEDIRTILECMLEHLTWNEIAKGRKVRAVRIVFDDGSADEHVVVEHTTEMLRLERREVDA